MTSFVQSWLLQSATVFLIVGSIAGMLVGVVLVFRPQLIERTSRKLNVWVSTRHLDKALERSFNIDFWFYRYRYLAATLLLLGALYVLYFFTARIERESAVATLSVALAYPRLLVEAMLDALVLTAMSGALCAILVALFMLFRPSLLRGFEEEANQWVSLRKSLKPMEISRHGLDRYVLRHARLSGVFLTIGSLYTLLFLIFWLGH